MMASTLHYELVRLAGAWLRDVQMCDVVLTDCTRSFMDQIGRELPDGIGWRGGVSVICECKASMADFKADQHKAFRAHPSRGMGVYRYYVAPPNVIPIEMLPPGWGLLHTSDIGLYMVEEAKQQEPDFCAELNLMSHQIAQAPSHPSSDTGQKYSDDVLEWHRMVASHIKSHGPCRPVHVIKAIGHPYACSDQVAMGRLIKAINRGAVDDLYAAEGPPTLLYCIRNQSGENWGKT